MTMSDTDSHGVPPSWRWVCVEDLGRVVAGGTPSTSDPANFGGDVPWITPADLSKYPHKFIERGARNITQRGILASAAILMPAGSILFSSRAPVGYTVIAKNPVSTNQGFKNLIPSGYVSTDYVYHYLKGNKALAESFASGTTFLEISGRKFSQIPVPLPPLPEQKRIVTKMEELFSDLDVGVEELKKAQAQLKRYRQSVLKAAFEGKLTEKWRKAQKGKLEPASVLLERIREERKKNAETEGKKYHEPETVDTSELPELPEGWAWARVGDIARNLQYGTSEKTDSNPAGIPVVRMGNIQNGELDFNNLKYLPVNTDSIADLTLLPGDILFNRTNSAELVGKTAVYKSQHPKASFASYLIRIQLLPKSFNPLLLSSYINSLFGRLYIKSVVTQQVGQANVNGTKLAAMPVPILPLHEQSQLLSEIESRFTLADKAEEIIAQSLKQAKRLRQSILKKAFEGKLVPQDSSDEPAEKLLERIKAEITKIESVKPKRLQAGRRKK